MLTQPVCNREYLFPFGHLRNEFWFTDICYYYYCCIYNRVTLCFILYCFMLIPPLLGGTSNDTDDHVSDGWGEGGCQTQTKLLSVCPSTAVVLHSRTLHQIYRGPQHCLGVKPTDFLCYVNVQRYRSMRSGNYRNTTEKIKYYC